jgi:purine-binding chemotaxis protein CheW
MSAPLSVESADSKARRGTAPANRAEARQSVCAFWLGNRCFGLEVSLVGEIVTAEAPTTIPMARPALRGLFNLRGTPVPLVQLGDVIGIDGVTAREIAAPTVLVIRSHDMVVGILIDRMEAVFSGASGRFSSPEGEENPIVQGFFEVAESAARVVTVLDPAVLLERLDQLRYVDSRAE